MKNLVSLGDVVQINPRPPKQLKAAPEKPVSFLPMACVFDDASAPEPEERAFKEVSKGYTYFERNDVLLAKITPCFENGKAAFLDSLPHAVGFGSTEFHVLRATSKIDPKYLFYMVWNPRFRFSGERNMTGSAGQKRVPVDFLKKYKIPLPPLEEQKRIAAILDKADGVRRKRQQAMAMADEFLRSVFLDMFGDPVTNPKGWEVKKLGDIADIASGVTKGKRFNGRKTVFVPYMRVANVQDGYIDTSDIQNIEVLESDRERFQLQLDDLLLTEGGDPDKLGRGAVWKNEVSPCIHQNHIFRVRVDQSVAHPEYLSSQVGSRRGKIYFLKSAKQTTGIATINKTQLKNYPTLLPPLEKQHEYARLEQEVSRKKQTHEKLFHEAEQLFNSISSSLFGHG